MTAQIMGDGVFPEAEAVRDVQQWPALQCDVLLPHLARFVGSSIAGKSVYNLEPMYDGARSLTPKLGYLDALRTASKVLDYQARNVEFLRSHGVDAEHLPYRYIPSVRRVETQKRWDVLFIGSYSPRRHSMLRQMRAGGLSVLHIDGAYGSDLDEPIAKARAVVNIHFDDTPHPLEVVRLNRLMAYGAQIISERGWDEAENAEYEPYVRFTDDIVRSCLQTKVNS
jgi:hypothetical protein